MTPRVLGSIEEIREVVGEDLGASEWFEFDQARVDAFASCTLDDQWIHVDQARSAAGPFGGTIAHGFLTLSLVPHLGAQVFLIDTPGAKLTYGTNTVHFPSPLLVGSRVRARGSVVQVTDLPAGTQVVLRYVIEVEGADKPACVAETVALLLPA
ncbi:MaoC family dehydratase [soil metagenome]